jgi:hypothetical protein
MYMAKPAPKPFYIAALVAAVIFSLFTYAQSQAVTGLTAFFNF